MPSVMMRESILFFLEGRKEGSIQMEKGKEAATHYQHLVPYYNALCELQSLEAKLSHTEQTWGFLSPYALAMRAHLETQVQDIQEHLHQAYPDVEPTIGGITQALSRYEQEWLEARHDQEAVQQPARAHEEPVTGMQQEWNELDPFWQAVEEHFTKNPPPKAVPQEEANRPAEAQEFEALLAHNTKEYNAHQEQAREHEEEEEER